MSVAEAILAELEVFGIKLGLASTLRLLRALGSPESTFPVVLVGGTNGKGSTANALSEIMCAAGHRVGLYTSPHLEEIEERVRVAGVCIGPTELASHLEKVVELGTRELGQPPTYFEALTVAAYLYFAEEGVDLAVVEVGLGGRLDATNAADPMLSIVTSISRDHTQVLGESLERIAREKAGIFRAGRKALCWVAASEARRALASEARRRGAVLVDVPRQVSWSGQETGLPQRRSLSMTTPDSRYRIDTALIGSYQLSNLALAVRAAESLREAGFEVGHRAVEEGIERCRWPGRCEVVRLPCGSQVLLEAAHNQEGIQWLSRQLEGDNDDGEKWQVIFGVLDDKPAEAMLETISTWADRVILTRPASPRAVDPTRLLPANGADRWRVEPCSEKALEMTLAGGARRVVVCGSIYLVGEVRRELRRRFGMPPPTVR